MAPDCLLTARTPPIDIEPTPLLRLPTATPLPAAKLGSARGIIAALFMGKLRQRFYSDIAQLGDVPDPPRQVATAYICLAACVAWWVSSIGTLALNPAYVTAHALGFVNGLANLVGFLRLRARKDPMDAMDVLILMSLVSIGYIAIGHSGVLSPVMLSMPTVAAVSALYQRPSHRLITLALGIIIAAVCLTAALGFIGTPTTYGPRSYVIAVFIVLAGSTLALGGLAWISIMSRDYSLDRVKTTNDAIVESAARARLALEAARVGLWEVPDVEQRLFRVSESFQAVTGYTGEEFSNIFGNLENFVHAEDLASLRAAFAAGRDRQTRIRTDFRLLTRLRGYRWFSARARYSANTDGTVRISGSLQDINFIKVAEEALRAGRDQARAANKAKSDFIAVMSHEVRTPLNAILGSVDLLKRSVHDPEAQEMIDLIDEAGHGLLAIVNDLLDVSRLDAGKLEITNTPTDVRALMRRTVEFWTPQASDKGLSLSVEVAGEDGVQLMIDAGRIRQIIGNLISNAIKFTDTGSVKVHLALQPTRDGRVQLTISVADTGPGVPSAIAESIFAAFEQAPGHASRGGAGLGLFISRRLARMMGGDLTLESSVGGGAHFRLNLIAGRVGAPNQEDTTEAAEAVSWDGLHLLCVDDNENNRRIAELLLSRLGFQVTLAASGAEAIDLCAMQVFDVILMDIVMPEQDGMETLRQLRGDDESLNRATPAIALTAKLSAADLDDYRAAGFEGVAGKPIDVAALAAEITRIIAKDVATADAPA